MDKQIKTSKGIKIIASLIFMIGLIMIVLIVNKQQKRILYIKENKVFSILENGEGLIDLSKRGIQLDSYQIRSVVYGDPIIISNDRRKIYFVKNYNVWSANTDGTKVKQITNNISTSPPFEILLAGMSNDKTKLLFIYLPIETYYETIINPNVKYGYYYYDSLTDTVKYIGEELTIDSTCVGSNFVGFVGNEPIYANFSDGYLYKLDPNSDKFTKFSKVPIPAISWKMYINKEKEFVIYEAAYAKVGWGVWRDNTIPDDYSQIVLFNYQNGTKIGISKVGKFAEYQFLSVSPKFQNVIFGHLIYEEEKNGKGKGVKRIDYYHYNIKNKQINLLPVNTVWLYPLWINEYVFLYPHYPKAGYVGPFTVYKFDLKSGRQIKFLENINNLIIP